MTCAVGVVVVKVPVIGMVVDGVRGKRSGEAGKAIAGRAVGLCAVRNVQWGSAQES